MKNGQLQVGKFWNGVPVKNLLEHSQRQFAFWALDSLKECLDFNDITFDSLETESIALAHPAKHVRDVKLRLADGGLGFEVTHGLHKRFTIDISDVRSARALPVPRNMSKLRALVAKWSECVSRATAPTKAAELSEMDVGVIQPAIAAACRYAPDWRHIEVVPVDGLHQPSIKLWLPNYRYVIFKSETYWSGGDLSPTLASQLDRISPYVAIWRTAWAPKSFTHIQIGPWAPISATNELDALEMFRMISEAHKRGWELIEKTQSGDVEK